MLCTAVIVFPLVLLGVRGSEPLWIATSAMLGIVMWRRRIGRLVDEQRDVSEAIPTDRSMLQDTLRLLLQGAAFFLFLLFRMRVHPRGPSTHGRSDFLPARRSRGTLSPRCYHLGREAGDEIGWLKGCYL